MKSRKSIGWSITNIKDWIISYLVVLIIPIAICSVFFLYTYSIIWEETQNSNTVALQSVASDLDAIFTRTFSIEYAIQMNDDIQDAADVKLPLNAQKRLLLIRAAKAIGDCIGDSLITSCYVYYPNSQMTLINDAYLEQKDIYERIAQKCGYSYEEWDVILKQKNDRVFLVNSGIGSISYITSIPLKSTYVKMNIIIGLDDVYIQGILSGLDYLENSGVLLADSNNNILAERNLENIDIEHLSKEIDAEKGYQKISMNGKMMMVSCIQLSKANLKVISVIPYDEFWSDALENLSLFWIALALCIFIGLLVSFFFSLIKHRTWGRLNAIASKKIQTEKNNILSRNKEITAAIEDIVTKYDTMQNQIASVNSIKKELLITSALKGRIRAEEIENILKKNDVEFEIGNYAVVLFHLNSYERFYDTEEVINDEKDLLIIKQAIISIVHELNQKEFTSEILNVDESIVCIVNFGNLAKEECYEEINLFARNCKKLAREKLSVLLTISISDVHKHVFSLKNAYSEAFRVMEYQAVMSDEMVMNYMEMVKKTQTNYLYSLENETALIHWIYEGKEKEALQLFDEIYEANIVNNNGSEDLSKCLAWDLTATVLRAENELRNKIKLPDMQDLVDNIKDVFTLYDAKKILTGRIQAICREVNKLKETKGDNTSKLVKEYINAHYADQNLSNSEIANYFNMNVTYLSGVFKENTGITLLSYIHKVRLEKAKELLETTDLNLEEISGRVGCNNSVYLTRLFKKYEGITPAAYRKNSKKH